MSRKLRVLLVDDLPLLLEEYAQDFRECGLDIETAHYKPDAATQDGVFGTTEAIARYAKFSKPPFDGVLTDIDCNRDEFGMRLAKQLVDGGYDRNRVMLFSQTPCDYQEDRLHDWGIRHLWRKPIGFNEIDTMANTITRILTMLSADIPQL